MTHLRTALVLWAAGSVNRYDRNVVGTYFTCWDMRGYTVVMAGDHCSISG
jgi:dihydroxyacetone kinase